MRNEMESERKKKEEKSPKRASLSLLCDRSYNYGTQCAHTRILSARIAHGTDRERMRGR